MNFQEIKSESRGEDVARAHGHVNERAEDISNIIFDYEDGDKIPIKEEIKQEIKSLQIRTIQMLKLMLLMQKKVNYKQWWINF